MLPYSHPTSVVLVDDDASFLQSFKFYFGDSFNCRSFQRPGEALAMIDAIPPQAWQPPCYLSAAHGAIDPVDFEPGDAVLQLKTAQLSALFTNPARFALPTVAVVDFAMPGMSGIEFLKRIQTLPLRRLMLTGRADERTAIDAFNAGIIDGFFMKHEPELAAVLTRKIEQLQVEFFTRQTATLKSVLALAAPFAGDALIDAAFAAVCEQHQLVEHCVLTEPPGVLGLKSDGTPVFMLVVDDDTLRAAIEIATEEEAPLELIELLRRGDQLSQFPTPNGFYSRSMASNWRNYIWPCTRIDGQRPWSTAVITEPRRLGIASGKIASYDDFLTGVTNPA